MKRILLIMLLTVLLIKTGIAQDRQKIDSLIRELSNNKPDSQKLKILIQLNSDFWESDLDSSLLFGQQALQLAQQTGNLRYETLALQRTGGCYRNLGDYPKSLDYCFRALKIADDHKFKNEKIDILGTIATAYESLKDYPKAISYFQEALALCREIQSAAGITHCEAFLATTYSNYEPDSAHFYMQKALNGLDTLENTYLQKTFFTEMGIIQFKEGDYKGAFQNTHRAILINQSEHSHRALAIAYNSMADFFQQLNMSDSGKFYAKKGLEESQANRFKPQILRSLNILAKLYETSDLEKSLHYLKEATKINDELFGAEKNNNLQKTLAEEQERQRRAESEEIAYKNRLKQYAFLAGFGALFIIVFILYRNNLQRKKANSLLLQQKEKIEVQKKDLEQTLNELKATQGQLVQSAKMASLGELTAGIAHEIQNPLNFVNNFSEVNKELLVEMKDEMDKGNLNDAKMIANDIIENQEKINHHGKRADSIVKGMLQHSRASSGQQELTDINALAGEFLRLAFHGLRAKDKTFNAKLETDFDNSVGKISIVPQDIGRVLVNLFNNAFYAVNEKKKSGIENYEPAVSLSTKKVNGKPDSYRVEIKVKDNGNGIAQNVLDKIFQPFFTTKPTGQGTGLGLSLAYDIVKAHGGDLKVDSKEGKGSEFIIQLPTT